MRIAFVGAVDFSRHCLERLCAGAADVALVLTPRAEAARGNSDYVDLAPVAAARAIPCVQFTDVNEPAVVEALRAARPDVVFVCGLSQIVGRAVRDVAPHGCIGSHPSLLPRDRGRHPLIWPLVDGVEQSGLTFFVLDDGVDTGDIVWQRSFRITDDDDASTLYQRIKDLASGAMADIVAQLSAGTLQRRPQDHAAATYRRRRTAADGEIVWNGPARGVFNLVRALTRPYPGAQTCAGSRRLTVWKVRLTDECSSGVAGCVVAMTPRSTALVATGDRLIELLEWEPRIELRAGELLGAQPVVA